MLYYLSQFLQQHAAGTAWADYLSPLRVFRYITFRSAGAAVTAFLLSLWLGPKVISWLKQGRVRPHYAEKTADGGSLAARRFNQPRTPDIGRISIRLWLDLSPLAWGP